ncbi:hypothetical protein WA026_012227 [Henosepilachna vigintioctopunctata]|uniref:Major facilitator superfamily (MFS) profile domain-containing protein n=1 Tax=Henosepilachna vigintioctopunctata TaxID=420089 RepID=A0AAW1VEC6_9CUCU
MYSSSRYYVYITSFISQILSFVCGTLLTWSSPMLIKLTDLTDNPLDEIVPSTSTDSSLLGSLLTLGAIFGSFFFGILAGKIGRKPVLLSLGVPFVISFLMLAFCNKIGYFFFARAFSGFALGGVFTVIPMYNAEISEKSNRGMLGAAMNCFITLGLVTTDILGPYVPWIWYHIIMAIFPAVFIVLFLFFCPESPHYLVMKDIKKAEESLSTIRGTTNVKNELDEIKETVEKAQGGSFMDIFRSKGLRKAFLIGVGCIFFQQFSGINVVLFYGQKVFEDVGGGMPSAFGPIILTGVQFTTSFITPIASDRSGRKILLIISHISMAVSQVFFGLYFFLRDNGTDVDNLGWLPISTLILYTLAYNIGSGPIPWALVGELFPSNVKDLASSGVSAVCWICGFLITQEFQTVVDAVHQGPTFWIFAVFGVVATLFVCFFVIETKGKSLQQIQDELDS